MLARVAAPALESGLGLDCMVARGGAVEAGLLFGDLARNEARPDVASLPLEAPATREAVQAQVRELLALCAALAGTPVLRRGPVTPELLQSLAGSPVAGCDDGGAAAEVALLALEVTAGAGGGAQPRRAAGAGRGGPGGRRPGAAGGAGLRRGARLPGAARGDRERAARGARSWSGRWASPRRDPHRRRQRPGRRLEVPPGQATRPTSEKVRAAVFNMLGQFFDGGAVLDLYAGTGALALEALSRGCASAVCVEADRRAVEVLRRNAEALGFAERVEVRLGRVGDVAARLPPGFALAFVDPPYQDGPEAGLALAGPLLLPGGRAVAEHDARRPPPERIGPLARVDSRRYGGTGISIYVRE